MGTAVNVDMSANMVSFTIDTTQYYGIQTLYLKQGYIDYFNVQYPIALSGENVTLWKQTVSGGNISISGDVYGNTEISGNDWPVTILGEVTQR